MKKNANKTIQALFKAIKKNNTQEVKFLLGQGLSAYTRNRSGKSAFAYAIKYGNLEIEELLEDSLEKPDHFDTTPLMYAVRGNNTVLVKQLLHAGANPNASTYSGHTALMFAGNKDPEITSLLLQYNAQVNAKTVFGWTALMEAAYYNDAAMVQQLLQAGAKVALKNHLGRTALIDAQQRGHTEIVKLLLAHRAKKIKTRV
ncbi:MAG: ankyrin repeat domain-containing protein [Candidatus Babeliales bacterium]